MWLRQSGLIFKGLQPREPALVFGTAHAKSSSEAPAAELCNDDAVCSYDYEIPVWHSSLDSDCRPVPDGWGHYLRAFFWLAACPGGRSQTHHFPDREIPARERSSTRIAEPEQFGVPLRPGAGSSAVGAVREGQQRPRSLD